MPWRTKRMVFLDVELFADGDVEDVADGGDGGDVGDVGDGVDAVNR